MEETQGARLSGFSLCDTGYVRTRAVLQEGASGVFRGQAHLAPFCGSPQPSKCLQSTRGQQGAVLKASASFFTVTLPLTFLQSWRGKETGNEALPGLAVTLCRNAGREAETGLVQHLQTEKYSEGPGPTRQPTGGDSWQGRGVALI